MPGVMGMLTAAGIVVFALFSSNLDSGRAAPAVTALAATLAATPDGGGCVLGSQAGMLIRPFAGGKDERLATQLEHVHALAFSPDGKLLAAAGGMPADSGVVELWSWPGRKLLGRLEGHDDLVYDVAWLPSGTALATASADRTVRLWNPATRQATATLTGHSGPVLALAVSPDGALLCSGSADQTIRVWDAATGKLLRALTNHLGPIHGLTFRAGDKHGPPTLASAGGDGTVRVWQPAIGRMVRILRHPAPVYAVAWSQDGDILSGAKDGRLRRFEGDGVTLRSEHELSRGRIISLAVCAPTGQLLAGDSLGKTFARER